MAEDPAAPQEEAPAAETRLEDTRRRPGSPLVETLERLARWTVALLARPRARTVVVGVGLILVGALWVTHSFWTFPIVLVGILMVIVAWVGSRLEGRFAVEWNEAGAGFELRARFRAAHAPPAGPALAAPRGTTSRPSTSTTTSLPVSRSDIPEADTVDDDTGAGARAGEIRTIAVDADGFRALVRAAEQLR